MKYLCCHTGAGSCDGIAVMWKIMMREVCAGAVDGGTSFCWYIHMYVAMWFLWMYEVRRSRSLEEMLSHSPQASGRNE